MYSIAQISESEVETELRTKYLDHNTSRCISLRLSLQLARTRLVNHFTTEELVYILSRIIVFLYGFYSIEAEYFIQKASVHQVEGLHVAIV